MSLFFEDINIGDEYISPGRTITEADVVNFAGVTGDFHQLHTDEQFCQQYSPFKTRIAHGLLGLCFATALMTRLDLTNSTTLAFLGMSKLEFKAPIMIGDTIRARITFIDKRETKKGLGIVTSRITVINQKDEEVQVAEQAAMIARKP